jgi:L-serine dehydratase
MSEISIFDIAGPIMVGPSSSHTAGACKIGQFARALFHGTPRKITFYLHGSFGEVYKGHATDKALLGGILKMRTSDIRIKDSFKIAKQKHIEYKFVKKDLGSKYHPNTVKIEMKNSRRKMSVTGSSVGGGVIEILKIDNFNIQLRGRAGKYLSLVVRHDKNSRIIPELIRKVNRLHGIKIHNYDQKNFKNKTLSILHTEGRRIKLPEVIELEKTTKGVDFVRSLSKLEKQ